MDANRFVELVQQNAARVTRYQSGGDGSGGGCDCIGLIIGALRMGGVKWPWTHGSNYSARYRMRWLSPVNDAKQLTKGLLVYKARDPESNGYSLPNKYLVSGNLLDYYHVGVVISTAPLNIMHCTTVDGGIQHDSKLGRWNYCGEIDLVTYTNEEASTMETVKCKVIGGTLNLRSGPGKQYPAKKIPNGAQVDAEWCENEWVRVEYNGASGYVMREYLEPVNDTASNNGDWKRVKELAQQLAEALEAVGV